MTGQRPEPPRCAQWRRALAEFTGERVVPGEVDVDLLNEHLARYAFAARLARGKRVLDAGCGAGYGSVELAGEADSVVGIDVAPEAVAYAREHYQLPNLRYEQASCTALPDGDGSFDLVVAFEVIEHLEDWRGFLAEARRVLTANGQLVVSTPNRLYYTESRGTEGANPFHVHEFDFAEFSAELQVVFPHVSLFLENHVEGVTFQPFTAGNTVEVRVDAGEPAPDNSHFFVAVCANRPQLGNPTFVYVPRAANVLRERERHIALLEQELGTKNQWLDKAQEDLAEFDREHQKLLEMFRGLKEELERANEWAESLNQELAERRARVTELQEELARDQESARKVVEGYEVKIADMEGDLREKTQWAIDTETRLNAEVRKQTEALAGAVEQLHKTEKELEERTAWAMQLQEEGRRLEDQVTLYRASRWVKIGRKVGLGPDFGGGR
jgi:SAM-dependent methyltransferase